MSTSHSEPEKLLASIDHTKDSPINLAESQPPSQPPTISSDLEVKDETSSAEEYLHGSRLIAVSVALMLTMFIVSLDNTILGTAIPKITDDFPDLTKVGWYGSAYFMTFGGFQSSWGKLYKYFSLKLWFLVALFIFEVGSLICGVAKDPVTLIVGRAIAGMGGAGVGTGVFTMIGLSTTPEKRPTLIGYVGAAYGLAAVLGPIVGGALTESVSWRWCFYINLPIGGVTSVVVIFLFTTNLQPTKASTKEKLLQMDPVGVILMMSLIISYILALQYGGQTHAWNNSTVIGLLVGFGLMLPAFIAWEIYQKERAMIVPRLFLMRHIWTGSIFMFFFAGAYFTVLYYLPIYFQSVYSASPIGSGVRMLAMIIPMTLAIVVQSPVLSKIGVVPLFWIIGGALGALGCGLFYTMDATTSTGKWIGYQLIVGFTSGLTFQVAISYAQVKTKVEDMSQTTAIINFFTIIGGCFFVSAAQSAFNNELLRAVTENLPEIHPASLLEIGATEIRHVFSSSQLPHIIDGYMDGLRSVFAITIGAFGVSSLIGVFGGWNKLHSEDLKDAVGGGA